jgi:small redox-active disulfide protein 2
MKIEVLGPGCRNCEILYENVVKALDMADLRREVQVDKVKDVDYFLKKGVFATPGLIVDGEVVSTARVLTPDQILDLLKSKGFVKADG